MAPTKFPEGPSPRVRGAALLHHGLRARVGTIPAGAGSRRSTGFGHVRLRDHPRGSGEQASGRSGFGVGLGPSPRVRGAGSDLPLGEGRVGTIPARAGSRRPGRRRSSAAWSHPRACREQKSSIWKRTSRAGPSPRMRGAGTLDRERGLLRGTIPAGAGSRQGRHARSRAGRDHPRGCGEQLDGGRTAAGARDHPRVCGEQTRCSAGLMPSRGTSPRMQGTVVLGPAVRHVVGIIPAGAGSRSTPARSGRPGRDHPRACREQVRLGLPWFNAWGPSPARAGSRLYEQRLYFRTVVYHATFIESGIANKAHLCGTSSTSRTIRPSTRRSLAISSPGRPARPPPAEDSRRAPGPT